MHKTMKKNKSRIAILCLLLSFTIHGQSQVTNTAHASSFSGAATPNGFSLKRGINVSYGLSQVNANHPIKYEEKDAAYLASLGFDNVRLPVDEKELWDEAGHPLESNWTILYSNIGISLKHHLKAVIDLHIVRSHYFNAAHDGTKNTIWYDTTAQNKFYQLWRELSSRLGHYPNDQVAYEILNEPVAKDPEDWNLVMNKAYAAIRKQEPDRTIVIGSNLWQSAATFPALKVPPHDPNIILSFHSYTPMLITHYRASWVGTFAYDGPVQYPGVTVDSIYAKSHYEAALVNAIRASGGFKNCDRETIEKNILVAVKRAKELGLPLQCGEFGCLPNAGRAIRLQYYRDMISIFTQYNIAYASWDYHGSFSVVYNESGQPDNELTSIATGKTGSGKKD